MKFGRKTFATDEVRMSGRQNSAPDRPPDLTPGMVHTFLRHIMESVDAQCSAWRKQLAFTPRGADFDLRGAEGGDTVLDTLTMTGDALGEALARGDATHEVGQSILPHLSAAADRIVERRRSPASDQRRQSQLATHREVLKRLEDDTSTVGKSLADLANLAARSAGKLDPDAARRIFDRMRNIGDATMRLLEDRIASSGTREEGKRLRALRDDFKTWLEERNSRVDQMQTAVDELNIRSNALRNECLMQAKRLAAAASLAAQAAGRRATDGPEQASPEAAVFAAALRALLLESHTDVTAPVRE